MDDRLVTALRQGAGLDTQWDAAREIERLWDENVAMGVELYDLRNTTLRTLHDGCNRQLEQITALRALLEEWLRVPCAIPEDSSLYPHYLALRNSTTRALLEIKQP